MKTKISNNNFLKEKLRKLDNFNQKEEEYLKIKEKKNEINIFRKKTDLNEEKLSQIKQQNNHSERDSSFFSAESQCEIDSYNLKGNSNKNIKDNLSKVISSNDNDSSSNISGVVESKGTGKENKGELYSVKSKGSKKTLSSKNEDSNWMRQSVKSFKTKKLEKVRISVKLSDLNIRKKENESLSKFNIKKQQENNNNNSEILSMEEEELDKSKNDEEENEEKEEEEEEETITNENFIQPQNQQNEDEEEIFPKNKVNLVEYDLFYKEQYLKNDVFKYDVENIKDEEVEKINKEMNKLDIKRKLIEKKK